VALLIDTSVLIDLERANPALPPDIEGQGIVISAITASELLDGVERAADEARRARRATFVERILDIVAVLPIDLDVARVHARIWANLLRQGKAIGAHDLLIAATALAHDLPLLTRNAREFTRVEGLRVLPSP
jgi:predicted nucleic acid-binding protein